MTENELFLKSHEQLLTLVRWLATPMIVVPKDYMKDFMGISPEPGLIISKETADKAEDFSPIDHTLKDLILKTFCESHSKLSHD